MQIFDPAAQAELLSGEDAAGAGPGLLVASDLVRAMGGTLRVRSWSGRGTQFCFEIPVALASAASDGKTHGSSEQKSASVLLVEDSDLLRWTTSVLLRQLGCSVDTASDGREAIRRFRERPYAVVLMDTAMPELDGYRATAEIRGLGRSARRTRIVGLASNSMDSTRARCLAAGMDDSVVKPVRADDLRAVLAGRPAQLS